MAHVIEFYIPARFHKRVKWPPRSSGARCLSFRLRYENRHDGMLNSLPSRKLVVEGKLVALRRFEGLERIDVVNNAKVCGQWCGLRPEGLSG